MISKERTGKDHSYNLSSKKIRTKLGWKPLITLDEGLKKTEYWINKNLQVLRKLKFEYVHKK